MKNILSSNVLLDITFDNIITRTSLRKHTTKNDELKFPEKSFFDAILGSMGEVHGGKRYGNGKNIHFAGLNKNRLITDCGIGNTVNGVRKPILCSFS